MLARYVWICEYTTFISVGNWLSYFIFVGRVNKKTYINFLNWEIYESPEILYKIVNYIQIKITKINKHFKRANFPSDFHINSHIPGNEATRTYRTLAPEICIKTPSEKIRNHTESTHIPTHTRFENLPQIFGAVKWSRSSRLNSVDPFGYLVWGRTRPPIVWLWLAPFDCEICVFTTSVPVCV